MSDTAGATRQRISGISRRNFNRIITFIEGTATAIVTAALIELGNSPIVAVAGVTAAIGLALVGAARHE